ncbi:hypothetical protein F6X40_10415 [Paraburkholderia sp. UCT31]|uniref:type I-E CRISPR-associated protein Cse2/CasB n=1 Tax=Paraburkholderia sp. UCT31 TaxID=2615209 RepID=UPI0016562776|nr:type I-E CRISPR-associated protein Cse2/CasB [Paraburkholderia sp. UCT31]MBC8737220.1 hypothetical protein [Paraburkholderia sp. UCT31]
MTNLSVQRTSPRAENTVVGKVSALRQSQDPSFFRLRRGTSLLDAMLEPAFHQIKEELKANQSPVKDELLALAVLLLARLDEKPSNTRLARALASSTSPYSAQRFSTLIRCEEPEELFTHLQRAVRYCDNRVCPFDLARIVFGWRESQLPYTRKRLISEFYGLTQEAAA